MRWQYLRAKAEGFWDTMGVCARHAAADLLAELPHVRTGSLQVLQQDGETRLLLSRVQEGTQTRRLHSHAVQCTLGKLQSIVGIHKV